jgi:tetratricopeptide (TPR) repeat protein
MHMESSESLYNEILSGGPSRGTLFLVLSRMKNEGLIERVIEECTKALGGYPDDIQIRKLLAEAYCEAGRIPEAEAEIKAVTGKINELMTSYRFQAQIYLAQGKTEQAIEALKLYLIHCPDDSESYALLESMLPKEEAASTEIAQEREGLPAEEVAEALAQPINEPLPDIATPTLAEVYYDQGKTREAIEIYEKVIERHPDDSGSRLRLDELKAIAEQTQATAEKEMARVMAKKKMTSILESWLEGLRIQSKAESLSGR